MPPGQFQNLSYDCRAPWSSSGDHPLVPEGENARPGGKGWPQRALCEVSLRTAERARVSPARLSQSAGLGRSRCAHCGLCACRGGKSPSPAAGRAGRRSSGFRTQGARRLWGFQTGWSRPARPEWAATWRALRPGGAPGASQTPTAALIRAGDDPEGAWSPGEVPQSHSIPGTTPGGSTCAGPGGPLVPGLRQPNSGIKAFKREARARCCSFKALGLPEAFWPQPLPVALLREAGFVRSPRLRTPPPSLAHAHCAPAAWRPPELPPCRAESALPPRRRPTRRPERPAPPPRPGSRPARGTRDGEWDGPGSPQIVPGRRTCSLPGLRPGPAPGAAPSAAAPPGTPSRAPQWTAARAGPSTPPAPSGPPTSRFPRGPLTRPERRHWGLLAQAARPASHHSSPSTASPGKDQTHRVTQSPRRGALPFVETPQPAPAARPNRRQPGCTSPGGVLGYGSSVLNGGPPAPPRAGPQTSPGRSARAILSGYVPGLDGGRAVISR
ncbi:hypothetical protein AAY473_023176 [Plecturocebus cupreus]